MGFWRHVGNNRSFSSCRNKRRNKRKNKRRNKMRILDLYTCSINLCALFIRRYFIQMVQYVQRVHKQDTTGIYLLLFFSSLIALTLLSVVIYNWCKRIEKQNRDTERKAWKKAREFAHRVAREQWIPSENEPQVPLRKKLKFVF